MVSTDVLTTLTGAACTCMHARGSGLPCEVMAQVLAACLHSSLGQSLGDDVGIGHDAALGIKDEPTPAATCAGLGHIPHLHPGKVLRLLLNPQLRPASEPGAAIIWILWRMPHLKLRPVSNAVGIRGAEQTASVMPGAGQKESAV